MAGIAASGGSTNGILHLLAIAREAGTALSLADLAGIARRTPVLASLAPSGRWMAEDFHRVGGTAALIRELLRGGHVDGSAPTVAGPTLEEATADAASPDGEVLLPLEQPFKPSGALYALRGNLAPDGSLVKLAGTERRAHTAARRACSTARKRAPTPCDRGTSRRATCSSSATRARPAGRGCGRC